MKILLVDDEPDFLEQAKLFLEREADELNIDTISSAVEALELLESGDYDGIVSDYQMPEMDGLDFLKVIRMEKNSDIPFIIFTGRGREEVAIEALNLGANRYLQKGGDPRSQYGVLAQAAIQEIEHHEAERSLNESEERYRSVFESLDEAVFVLGAGDDYGEIVELNPATEELFGFSRDELIGKDVLDLIAKGEEKLEPPEGEKRHFVQKKVRKDGTEFWSKVTEVPFKYEGGETYLSLCRDIAERKKMEEKLKESEEKYKMLAEGSSHGIYLLQGEEFKLVNDGLVQISGYSREELENMDFLKLVHPDHREEIKKWTEQALTGDLSGLPEKHEFKALRKDGSSVWVRLTPALVEHGDKYAIVGNVIDITDRKEIEEKIEQYKIGVEASVDSIYMIDKNYRYVFANDEHLSRLVEDGKICQENGEGVVGEEYEDIHSEEDLKTFKENLERVLETGEPYTEEHKFLNRDRWSNRTYSPVTDEETGEFEAVVIVSQDVTERKKTKTQLQKQQNKLEERVKELNCLYGISKLLEESGNSLEQILQKSVELIPPSWQYPEITCARLVVDDEEFRTDNHNESEWKMKSDIFVDSEKRGFLEVIYLEEKPEMYEGPFLKEERNLIEVFTGRLGKLIKQFELEEELRESEKRYRSIFEGLDEAVFVLRAGEDYGRILEMNSATEDLFGYFRDELIGKSVLDLVAAGEEKFGGPSEFERRDFTQRKVKKDGTVFWTEVTEVPFEYEGMETYLSIERDITERKEAKKRQDFLHSLLRHDVRNKSQIVEGYLELAEDYDLPGELKNYLSKAKKAAQDSMEIIKKVRTLIEIGEKGEIGEIDLCSFLEGMIEGSQGVFEEKNIELEQKEREMKVRGGSLLEELFSNLVENAVKHADCDRIKFSCEKLDDEVIIKVEDDGGGISDEIKEKIFERGFKEEGTGGSGLGLFLVKKIAESYGGSVDVKDSELGGARFDVHLKSA